MKKITPKAIKLPELKTADKIKPRKRTITVSNSLCRCIIYEDDYDDWKLKGWISLDDLKAEAERKIATLKGVV